MNVRLTPHSEDLLREHLARGGYHTPEEVIERALEILTETVPPNTARESRTSILELQGLGKKIWQGVDAQEYVDRERASWNG
jgi:Arc/MetJ-type ribon-helix-helix transcriptional regulator